MSTDEFAPLTPEELAAEGVTALPDKEVVSILDLAADINLAIDGAAPIDLAIALNANVVAPITGAVSANILANGSTSQALTDQGVMVTQHVNADAIATGLQDSTIDQSDTVTGGADDDAGRRDSGRPPTDSPPTAMPAAGCDRCRRRRLQTPPPPPTQRPWTARSSWTPPATSSARSTRPPGPWSTPPATSSAPSTRPPVWSWTRLATSSAPSPT